jgi:hypothetical protein
MLYYAVSNLWGGLNVMYYYLLYCTCRPKHVVWTSTTKRKTIYKKLHEDGNLTWKVIELIEVLQNITVTYVTWESEQILSETFH